MPAAKLANVIHLEIQSNNVIGSRQCRLEDGSYNSNGNVKRAANSGWLARLSA